MIRRTCQAVSGALPALAALGAVLALGPATAGASTSTPATSTAPSTAQPASAMPSPASTTPLSVSTSPLPASDYRVRNVCRAPSPGRASCLAQELVPKTAAAAAHTHPIGVARATPLKSPSPAKGFYGLTPEDLKDAYFPGESPHAPEAQTIALVEAYNDFDAKADLNKYSEEFGLPTLPECSAGAKEDCFEQVNQDGETRESDLPFPKNKAEDEKAQKLCVKRAKPGETVEETLEEWEKKEEACALAEEAEGWSQETSLDIEIAHAICQNCRIVLVEAESPEDGPLEEAEDTAAKPVTEGGVGATEISNSWGGEEEATDSEAFNHPGIVITAAAGDNGYLDWTEAEEAKALREPYHAGAESPASSPHVVAVGGTSLELIETDGKTTWQGETVWNDDNSRENNGAGGSGCSSYFPAPAWQLDLPNWSAVGCENRRAVADVSADGDPYTGVAVYDSESYCEYEYPEGEEQYVVRTPWCTFGGTSVATPLIAAMYALAGGAHGVAYPAETLYKHLETGLLHPVTGSNGECDGDYASGCTGSMDPSSPRFDFDCGQGVLICNAAAGCEGEFYAGPTGVGSPNGIGAFRPEEHPAKDARPCGSDKSDGGDSSSGESKAQGPFPPAPQSATSTSVPANDPDPSKSPATQPTVPSISGLALTKTARTALSRRHIEPNASQLAITFTLNTPTAVRVALEIKTIVHGHAKWKLLPVTLTLAATKGRDAARLRAHRRLAPGFYRLTVTPVGGKPRTLTFRVS